MPEPLSVAVLGCWHVHAAGYAKSVLNHPDARLCALWDADPQRGRAGAAELATAFVPDLDELLARPDLDGVIVTTPTTEHHRVITRAARAGKHVFTEKLLAPTVGEAEDLVRTARESGVHLLVSLPRLYEGMTAALACLIAEGRLGRLTYTRVRMAHDGWVRNWLPERFADPEQAVGGALSDLGCHPAYLTQLFLGYRPDTVGATYTHSTGRAVEDNAVVTLTYPGGAIGVIEASFVTTPGAFTLELRGTEGSALYGFGSEKLLAKGRRFGHDGWHEVPVPADGPDPLHRWLAQLRAGRPGAADTAADIDTANLTAAVELTRLVVTANEAAERGATIDCQPQPSIPAPPQ